MVIDNLRSTNGIGRVTGQVGEVRNNQRVAVKKDFASILRSSMEGEDQVRFSKHAVERMDERGISLSPRQLERINLAVDRAQRKGLKESLIVVDDTAFVVSIGNKTVITVSDKSSLQDNIFTNIDGVVFI